MTTNTPTNGQLYNVLRKMLAAMAFEPNLTHPYGSLINELEPTTPSPPIELPPLVPRPFVADDDPTDIIADFRGGEPEMCDECKEPGTIDSLNACSGDLWLCNACLRRYLHAD